MLKSDIEKYKKIMQNVECKFPDALSNILHDHGISQTDLAQIIGINNQTISDWLSYPYKTPSWINTMYKLNLFLYKYVNNFNFLSLYNPDFMDTTVNGLNLPDYINRLKEKEKILNQKEIDLKCLNSKLNKELLEVDAQMQAADERLKIANRIKQNNERRLKQIDGLNEEIENKKNFDNELYQVFYRAQHNQKIDLKSLIKDGQFIKSLKNTTDTNFIDLVNRHKIN